MSNQTHNQESITQYLLGALPEAEGERFDELSVIDERFADALNAAEKDLVDAYVQGELSDAALESFKSHYLASPLRREKVEFAQAFQSVNAKNTATQEGAARTVTGDETEKTEAKRKRRGWFPVLSVFTSPRPAMRWGMAAAVLLLFVAGSWLAWENARRRGQLSLTQAGRDATGGARERESQKGPDEQPAFNAGAAQEQARARGAEEARPALEPQPQPEAQREERAETQKRAVRPQASPPASGISIASFVLMPQMRGAGQLASVTVPAQAKRVAMRLELEPDDHPAYRVELLEQSGPKAVWRSARLKARARGDGAKALNIQFRAALLQPRSTYVLRVNGLAADGASEIVGDYPFRVVK